jgi:hypothetical protein
MRIPAAVIFTALAAALLLTAALACAAADDKTSVTDADQSAGAADEVAAGAAYGGAASGDRPVLLFGIGMHIEPLGAQVSDIVTGGAAPRLTPQRRPAPQREDYYNNRELYERHRDDILAVADIVEAHGGRMTIQAQTPFTEVAATVGDTVLSELAARGHELALHFHENAHLGPDSSSLPVETWCAVMEEEIGWIEQAGGVDEVRYWSGGNLYPGIIEAAACAGLDVYSDWKNPDDQTTPMKLQGINPWRPSGGTDGIDTTAVTTHDPGGPVVFLPSGIFDTEDLGSVHRRTRDDDQAFFDYLKASLMASLEQAEAGKVNVFHITVHPGQYKGDPDDAFAVIDRFLTEVVDPLVESGRLQWATCSDMADAYKEWEMGYADAEHRSTT